MLCNFISTSAAVADYLTYERANKRNTGHPEIVRHSQLPIQLGICMCSKGFLKSSV